MSLSVQVDAPVVLVPQSSKSAFAIRTQLGMMSVQNRFLTERSEDGKERAIVDSMKVELNAVELAR